MAKEDRTFPMKGIQDNLEDEVALRGLSNAKNLNKIDSSKPNCRKSTTNLFMQCSKEPTLLNEEIFIKKSFSFSGTPCESESKKQPLPGLQKNNTKINMRNVCKQMAQFERCLLKRAQLAREKNRQVLPITQDESHRQTNATVDLTLLRSGLESQNIQLNNPISDSILLSGNSANSKLPKSKSLMARKKIKNTTLNREQISKNSANPKRPKSKLQILRKIIPKNPSKPDQAPKIPSEPALPTSNSRISQKIPSKNSTIVEQASRTLTDAASARNNHRAVRKAPLKNTINADQASKSSVELVKSRSLQTRFQNDQRSEKSTKNQKSMSRASRLPVKKSTKQRIHKSRERNVSKSVPNRARSRSKSTDSSNRRRSEASIPIQQPTTTESPIHFEPINNDSVIEPENIPQSNQTADSNIIPKTNEPKAKKTSQTTPLPDQQKGTVTPANELQTNSNPPTNDQVKNAPPVVINLDDSHFTSPSERILNPDRNIEQSSPETRAQPIPEDPNSANAAKHDFEEWLRKTAAQSDAPRPIKTSSIDPYPVFPVIRPCDTDITNDPEDCKKKLEQKLERMHKLKQAYYADPEDNIPFINLAYTKEGVFVDEPIQNAFVYDDDFLKNNKSSEYSRWSSGIRGDQTESAMFSSPGLNQGDDKGSASFTSDKVVNNKSSHSKWLDKILDETEINMMENVLQEFQHKFNKLAINIQQASLTSETSSNGEPVQGPKQRVIIPKRSSRSDN